MCNTVDYFQIRSYVIFYYDVSTLKIWKQLYVSCKCFNDAMRHRRQLLEKENVEKCCVPICLGNDYTYKEYTISLINEELFSPEAILKEE